jgi:hypothetical protein
MPITDKIRSLAKQITYVVLAHAALYSVFCYAHGKVDILYSMDSFTPILIFFIIGPLVMAFFLTKGSARQWTIVLVGLLMAELIYNIYARFGGISTLVIKEPDFIWEALYEASFGIVLVLEVIGIYLTIKILQEIHKQLVPPSEK